MISPITYAFVTLDHSNLPERLGRGRATARSVTLDYHLGGRAQGRAEVAYNGLGWFA